MASVTLFNVQHSLVRNAKWFSICSKTVARWAFNCHRSDLPLIPPLNEPECAKSKIASDYVGTRWITNDGHPCLPWIYPQIKEEMKTKHSVHESKLSTKNYCRNPIGDRNGPFCFVADPSQLPDFKIRKEYCSIPKCLSSECRVSGTGAEYDGNITISRSKFECKLSEIPKSIIKIPENGALKNYSQTRNQTKSYCRNPDNNPFGPWCNTTDPLVKTDLCDLPDCTVNDACTMVTRSFEDHWRRYYFHAQWVINKFYFKIKSWDPQFDSGTVSINLMKDAQAHWYYSLIIGAENQTKTQLLYVNHPRGKPRVYRLLREKIMPKLIPAGYWQGFWVQSPPSRVELGFQGSDEPIFSWVMPEAEKGKFTPGRSGLISFSILNKHDVGFNFPCSYCLTERTETELENSFYPMNLWSESHSHSNVLRFDMITVNSLNDGPVHKDDNSFTFIKLYDDSKAKFLKIQMNFTAIKLTAENESEILSIKHVEKKVTQKHFWTTLTIEYSEGHIIVADQFQELLRWHSHGARVLKFYYFTVGAFHEITTWTANCPHPELETPINGGWSEWNDYTCSVPCGGGFGFRKRFCNNPEPNMIGEICSGPSTIDEECNQFECGCINPRTVEKSEDLLHKKNFSINVKENSEIILECEMKIVMEAKNDSPNSHLQWLKDGFRLTETKLKLDIVNYENAKLKIAGVQPRDSGVYMCVLYPYCLSSPFDFIITKIISVTVDTAKPLRIRKTKSLQLLCNGPILEFIYTDLHQSWILNDFPYVEYLAKELADIDVEIVEDVHEFHHGVWECYLQQNKLNLSWTTDKLKVEILEPPDFYTYLTEDDAPSIIFQDRSVTFVLSFLYGVVIIEIILVACVVFWFWKSRQELLGRW